MYSLAFDFIDITFSIYSPTSVTTSCPVEWWEVSMKLLLAICVVGFICLISALGDISSERIHCVDISSECFLIISS